jgi:putative transposase
MARRPRSSLNNGFFHVTTRGVVGLMIFDDAIDRIAFLQLLRRTIERHDWVCHAYCLMGTHYHLVIHATVDQLSTGMRQLNGIYAQHFNARYERRGHVFAERFSAWVLEDDDHFEATLAYVVGNPVRAGLCRSPEEWQWSGLGAPPPGTDPGLSLGSSEWRDASGKAA